MVYQVGAVAKTSNSLSFLFNNSGGTSLGGTTVTVIVCLFVCLYFILVSVINDHNAFK